MLRSFNVTLLRRLVAGFIVMGLLSVTAPSVLAADRLFKVEQVINDGKDTKETDAILTVKESSFEIMPDKKKFKSFGKEFVYTEIESADYSYSKKPMLSRGGAVAMAVFFGVFFTVPFLFMTKKNHWLSVQTETEFVVIKLDGNRRKIVAELENHGVKVATLKDDDEKKTD